MNKQSCPICQETDTCLSQKSGDYSIMHCRSCEVFYVSPLPSKDKHKGFHNKDYFYNNYAGSIENFYGSRNSSSQFKSETECKSARLNYVASLSEKGKILDVGTGQGLFLSFAKEKGWDVSGTDISPYVCNFLKSKGIKMFNGYLEDSDFPENNFDVVTIWHVLEHTYDPYATLLKAKKLLKANGSLFIAVPNTLSMEMILRRLFNKPPFREDADEWHFYNFNPKALRFLLKDRLNLRVDNLTSEWYMGSSIVDSVYNRAAQFLFRSLGTNICKTILLRAVKV